MYVHATATIIAKTSTTKTPPTIAPMAQTGKLDLSLPPVPPVFTGLLGEGAGWTALGVAGVERGQHIYIHHDV